MRAGEARRDTPEKRGGAQRGTQQVLTCRQCCAPGCTEPLTDPALPCPSLPCPPALQPQALCAPCPSGAPLVFQCL
jgi:hypothetical protein